MGRAIMKFRPRVPSSRVALEPLERRRVLSAMFDPGFPAPDPFAPEFPSSNPFGEGFSVFAPFDEGSPAFDPGATGLPAFDPGAPGFPPFDPGAPGFPAPGGGSLHDLIGVSPGDGAVVPQSAAPGAITVQLGNGLIQAWNDKTAGLYRLGDDGAATPIFGNGNWPEILKDPATNTVTIPLDGPLGPGRYRLALLGGFGSFSQMINNGSWDYMEDQTLAEFEVVAVQESNPFDAAIDAGTIGVDARSFPGALNSAGEGAYYKIELTGDQPLWRLGLQLDAQRLGSDLRATLTVYDALGNKVADTAGGRGLASAPNDPYLFAGLEPGTYYVAVSAASGAGDYRLTLAADPVTGPTRVTGFALDWTGGAPTGFTIGFSDAIAPNLFAEGGAPLRVVDAAGAIHSITLSAAADGLRRLSFVFDQPIPAGEYSLVAPAGGGLVDLIGRAPVADGSTPGLLASWTVAPYQANNTPAPGGDWLGGAHRESLIDNAVGAGGALSLRFGVGGGGGAGGGSGSRDPEPAAAAVFAAPAAVAPAPSASLIGVLDSTLFGRPAARSDGTPAAAGAIPPEGRVLLAGVARERLAGSPTVGDDGLGRSPDGELEVQIAGLWPVPNSKPNPKVVELRRAGRTDDGVQRDADALERIEAGRLVDASADLLQWLFGAPARPDGDGDGDGDAGTAPTDAQVLARLDADATEKSRDGRAEEGASRAGLGAPIGVIVLAALAYRLHRRPPRWWRRRRPTIQTSGEPRPSPAVPRGPRFMTPRTAAADCETRLAP